METRSTLDKNVALVQYQPHETSLAKALGLWRGLPGISGEVQNKGFFSVNKTFLLIR